MRYRKSATSLIATVAGVLLAPPFVTGATELPAKIPLVERTRHNRLLPDEIRKGWRLLFDGESGQGWQSADSEDFPESGWVIEDGTLTIRAAGPFSFRAGGDLFSRERFGDFILDFEFLLSEGANSGVKYRTEVERSFGFTRAIGCEYQLLDDARHADAARGTDGNRRLGSLYDLVPANPKAAGGVFRGVDSWNHGRIHLEAGKLAHYLNGARVLEVEIGSDAWRDAIRLSKFRDRTNFCLLPSARIVLQDHGDLVRFRNLRIRSLDHPRPDS